MKKYDKSKTFLYVLQYENVSKFGITHNYEMRKRQLDKEKNVQSELIFLKEYNDRKDALMIEGIIKKIFKVRGSNYNSMEYVINEDVPTIIKKIFKIIENDSK